MDINKESPQPIQSQKEADQVREYIIRTAVRTLGISRKQAIARVNALFESKLLNNAGSPDEPYFQIIVDTAMKIPQLKVKG